MTATLTTGSRLAVLQPGDVVAVRTPSRIAGPLIRLGAWLRCRPATVDHVAIVYDTDVNGITWVIEGRPGGVGRIDAAVYDNQWLISNAAQPKTDAQRTEIVATASSLLGEPYDWQAIGADAAEALGLNVLWLSRDFGDAAPGHVVCSSLASWVYHHVGLAEPATPQRWTTPGDWAAWLLAEGWKR